MTLMSEEQKVPRAVFTPFEEKMLTILKELHLILKNTSKITMTDYLKKKGLSESKSLKILVEGGIIENQAKSKRYPIWVWKTIEPNIHMAKKFVEEYNKVNEVKEQIKNREERKSRKRVSNARLLYTTTKYLWGLITIKKEYHYE